MKYNEEKFRIKFLIKDSFIQLFLLYFTHFVVFFYFRFIFSPPVAGTFLLEGQKTGPT